MNKYGVVTSAECGSFKTHEPHNIKEGFLGIGRLKCAGYTHRHYWKLDPVSLPGAGRKFFLFTVNWMCHCGDFQVVSKEGFYDEMLGKRPLWYNIRKSLIMDTGFEHE